MNKEKTNQIIVTTTFILSFSFLPASSQELFRFLPGEDLAFFFRGWSYYVPAKENKDFCQAEDGALAVVNSEERINFATEYFSTATVTGKNH